MTPTGHLSPSISNGPMTGRPLTTRAIRDNILSAVVPQQRECQMGRPIVLAVPSLIVFAFLTGAPGAIGQATNTDKERLVGSWTTVSITAGGGGSQAQPFGPNPNGTMMVDAGGHISVTTLRSNLPKFQSNNRTAGTADENKAIVTNVVHASAAYPSQHEAADPECPLLVR